MEVLRSRYQEQPTIRGELQVDHFGPEGRVAGKVYAFAAAGGRLRLEAVSPMETPVRTMAVDGETFSLVDQESQRCLEGPPRPCLIGQMVGLELSANHVAATLIGGAPLLRHRAAESTWNDCGFYELELEGEESGWTETLRFAFEQGQLVVTQAVIRNGEGVVLELEMSRHEPVGELLVPRRMIIRMPRSEADLRIEWRHLEVGISLPANAWRATCPAGYGVETAACEATSPLTVLEEPAPPVAPDPPEEGGSTEGGGEVPEEGGEVDLSEELGL